MGSLADLILASSSDVPEIVASDYPLGTFKGINVDGLDPLKLAALHSMFSAADSNTMLPHYQPIAEASVEGPWLIQIPGELIAFLAELAPQDQEASAAQWASTEQARKDSWSEDEAAQFLGRLVHFSQQAAFEGKELFLWIYS